MWFVFVKFKLCNGEEGWLFLKVECEFDVFKDNERKMLWVLLEMMFKNGIVFIKIIINGEEIIDFLKIGVFGCIKKYY